VTAEFAATCLRYGVTAIAGDHYAGEWPKEQFRKHGVEYRAAKLTKSELYVELAPRINSGQVELLDQPRLLAQLCALERRTGRTGHDTVDHPPGGHDDVANSVAGAIVTVARQAALGPYEILSSTTVPQSDEDERRVDEEMAQLRYQQAEQTVLTAIREHGIYWP
jgi:hypothetical protein